MEIEIPDSASANCRNTITLNEQVALAEGVPVSLSQVEELSDIVGHRVMRTPRVAIGGKVVHAGGVPRTVGSKPG